jgi:hypothetical protein
MAGESEPVENPLPQVFPSAVRNDDLACPPRPRRFRGTGRNAATAPPKRVAQSLAFGSDVSAVTGARCRRARASYCAVVCRFGSFQPGRGKWQVYPSG